MFAVWWHLKNIEQVFKSNFDSFQQQVKSEKPHDEVESSGQLGPSSAVAVKNRDLASRRKKLECEVCDFTCLTQQVFSITQFGPLSLPEYPGFTKDSFIFE